MSSEGRQKNVSLPFFLCLLLMFLYEDLQKVFKMSSECLHKKLFVLSLFSFSEGLQKVLSRSSEDVCCLFFLH